MQASQPAASSRERRRFVKAVASFKQTNRSEVMEKVELNRHVRSESMKTVGGTNPLDNLSAAGLGFVRERIESLENEQDTSREERSE